MHVLTNRADRMASVRTFEDDIDATLKELKEEIKQLKQRIIADEMELIGNNFPHETRRRLLHEDTNRIVGNHQTGPAYVHFSSPRSVSLIAHSCRLPCLPVPLARFFPYRCSVELAQRKRC